MEISVSEAEGRLTELIQRAESGEAVILTRDGRPTVQISAVRPKLTLEERKRLMSEFQASKASKVDKSGPSAARSQDFLYDENGLPK